MYSSINFYDTLDLKYPEIGIALEKIDRMNPGEIKFSIPILTPNVNNSSEFNETIHQTKNNLKNKDKSSFEVSNIKKSNYVKIKIPKELCALPGGKYIMESDSGSINNERFTISLDQPIMEGQTSLSGTAYENLGKLKYEVNLTIHDDFRYIEKGSKWIIVFVGGDINKPRVIGRYDFD